MKTYSLQEVAAMVLPPEWKEPERWLRRHLVRGELSGYKVGHTWRMTEDDVEALLARYRVGHTSVTPRPLSFTRTSRRRSA